MSSIDTYPKRYAEVQGCADGHRTVHRIHVAPDGSIFSYRHGDIINQADTLAIYPDADVCFCAVALHALRKCEAHVAIGDIERMRAVTHFYPQWLTIGSVECSVEFTNGVYHIRLERRWERVGPGELVHHETLRRPW